MLKIGDEIELEISNLSSSGSGVGYYIADTKRAVFVPLSVPGDKLKVKITSQKKAYYEAEIIWIIQPSKDRITPICPHFGICGACDWLNINYERQVEEKKKLLSFFFNKRKIKIPGIEVIKSSNPLYYRDRVRFTDGGFLAKKSNAAVKITECRLINKKFSELIKNNNADGCFAYDYKLNEITKNKAYYYIDGFCLAYFPDEFAQSNIKMNSVLAKKVCELAEGNEMLELYSGNGNFSIPLSRKTKSLTAVEGSKKGFSLLAENIKSNAIGNIIPKNEDVKKFISKAKSYDCIILDPPRAGSSNVLSAAAEKSGRIVYVSCNADAMAKEIKQIQDSFAVKKLILIDMFPQTRHFEAVALIERN